MRECIVASGWIAYADTSTMICATGETDAAAIVAAKSVGEDTSGEDYAWLCTAPATARLLSDTDVPWHLIDGIADTLEPAPHALNKHPGFTENAYE